jgi:phosphate starvation-inducible PhoH-like protein
LTQTDNETGSDVNKLVVVFDDNRLVRELLGEYDQNLALIEDRLGVEILAHGNMITLTGTADGVDIAKTVLEGLYKRLGNGEHLTLGAIDGAIRHAAGAPLRKPGRGGGARRKPDLSAGGIIVTEASDGSAQLRTRKRQINGRSKVQSEYLFTIERNELTFAIGPAGTGKTYLAVAFAAAALERGLIERLILSRPAVEAGEKIGFLPGDMREKVDPYLRPLYDALYDMLPPEKVEYSIEHGIIEIAPLAFMRGRTLSHSFIILDEAQNCTSTQMKMFLTRLGEGSRMVVTGDPSQIDLPRGTPSGLVNATQLLKGIDGIGHIAFTSADVVRHELVTRIVEAYDRHEKKERERQKKGAPEDGRNER